MDRLTEEYREEIRLQAFSRGAKRARVFGSRASGDAEPESDDAINFQVFLPLEFIALITQHILEQSPQLEDTTVSIQIGWVATEINEKRGKKKWVNWSRTTEDSKVVDICNYKPKRIPKLM